LAKSKRRTFGTVRTLPSGKHQALVHDPLTSRRLSIGTFDTKAVADRAIREASAKQIRGEWVRPQDARVRFEDYAAEWLAEKKALRAENTYKDYRKNLERHILPHFGRAELQAIDATAIKHWFIHLVENPPVGADPDKWKASTARKIYRTLNALFNAAVRERRVPINPCQIVGGSVSRSDERDTISATEVMELVEAAEPRYRLVILLAGFVALRFSEIHELRREDLDPTRRTVHVGKSKTPAGIRTSPYTELMDPYVAEHLECFAGPRYVFMGSRGGRFYSSRWNPYWIDLRTRMGHPDLTTHDLRHTALTLAAEGGATIPDLMKLAGHNSAQAVMRYLHSTEAHRQAVSDALSQRIAKELAARRM